MVKIVADFKYRLYHKVEVSIHWIYTRRVEGPSQCHGKSYRD